MNKVADRVKKHRQQLRMSGLRPIQIWVPSTSHKRRRKRRPIVIFMRLKNSARRIFTLSNGLVTHYGFQWTID
ncbi:MULTISPECIES: antitoxin MazE-like protein [Photorhabdus]|uniref:antitoxin MazE-like protein n=1 Tax=Photorhabdus TaxID=29487 RepID=UPI000DCAEE15|nr:antitoxin MazE family protein [Photorhabdus kleinii]RAX03626.1 hypothetical protein CKY03_01585 [Photorhabdus sp. S9-53]RAX03939.1 hypothetical protein CKY05_01585 [Photorhabdus sp. S10-54]RAX05976.1 hypothetical protein CKY04_01585 [Photorhabdus sp. S8-52]